MDVCPLTVAGPHRISTDFPFTSDPLRAPLCLDDIIYTFKYTIKIQIVDDWQMKASGKFYCAWIIADCGQNNICEHIIRNCEHINS